MFSQPGLKFPQLDTVPSTKPHGLSKDLVSASLSPPTALLPASSPGLLLLSCPSPHCGTLWAYATCVPSMANLPCLETNTTPREERILPLCSQEATRPPACSICSVKQLPSEACAAFCSIPGSRKKIHGPWTRIFFFFLRVGQRRIIFASVTVSAEWRQTPEQGGQEGSTPSKPHRGLQR